METWDAVRARRNTRAFADRPVRTEDLDRILEAGRRAPSATNWQPWDFIVVTDRDQLIELARVWQGAGHVAGSAATVAFILPKLDDATKRETAKYDLGQATTSMMIVAADLGIGTAHALAEDQKIARAVLGFPDDRFCAYVMSIGYPADRPLAPIRRPNRRPFDEVVHRDRW